MAFATPQKAPLLEWLRSLALPRGGDAPDEQLLNRFLHSHEEEAFRALVQRHGPMVYGVCQRLLRNTEDAENAFQATFLALTLKARTIRHGQALASWLHQVACRVALATRNRSALRCTTPPEEEMAQLPDPTSSPVEMRDLAAVLDEELARLPEKVRAPFLLVHLEGLSRKEVARTLGVSLPTLDRRLAKARDLLRTRLAQRGITTEATLTASALLLPVAAPLDPPLISATTRLTLLVLAEGPTASSIPPHLLKLVQAAVQGSRLSCLRHLGVFALLLAVAGISGGDSYSVSKPLPVPPVHHPVLDLPAPAALPTEVIRTHLLDTEIVPRLATALESLGGKADVKTAILEEGKAHVLFDWQFGSGEPKCAEFLYDIDSAQLQMWTDIFKGRREVYLDRPVILFHLFGKPISLNLEQVNDMKAAFDLLQTVP